MSDRTSFLAAIRANPDDDLPRLVFADWLDEHGEGERAAFIRGEIDEPIDKTFHFAWGTFPAVHTHPKTGEPPYISACIRLPTDRIRHGDGIGYGTSRGFVTEVSRITFAQWVQHADRILPESVGLTVRLTDRPVVEYRTTRCGSTECRFRGSDRLNGWHLGPLTATALFHRIWPEVKVLELPPEPRMYDEMAEVGENTYRRLFDRMMESMTRGMMVPEHILRSEPEATTVLRRNLRQVRAQQRQYLMRHPGPSNTAVQTPHYMEMEQVARELQNQIVLHTGRHDFD